VPFARAHEIAGACVRYCEARGIELSDLTPAQLTEISSDLDAGVLDVLTAEGSVASRNGRGGTAPDAVRAQLVELRAALT
jgi:argininosuccinate lyase